MDDQVADGIQRFTLRITIRPTSLREAQICSGNRKSSSRPDSERRLMNPETINVASMAAYQPNPRMALYGAAKAFVLSLTEALWEESRGTGLRVIALSPGATPASRACIPRPAV